MSFSLALVVPGPRIQRSEAQLRQNLAVYKQPPLHNILSTWTKSPTMNSNEPGSQHLPSNQCWHWQSVIDPKSITYWQEKLFEQTNGADITMEINSVVEYVDGKPKERFFATWVYRRCFLAWHRTTRFTPSIQQRMDLNTKEIVKSFTGMRESLLLKRRTLVWRVKLSSIYQTEKRCWVTQFGHNVTCSSCIEFHSIVDVTVFN